MSTFRENVNWLKSNVNNCDRLSETINDQSASERNNIRNSSVLFMKLKSLSECNGVYKISTMTTELCSCSIPVLCYWFQKNKIKKNSLF